MDEKSKIVFVLLFVAIAISIYLTYDRAIVQHNFETIDAEVFDESL